MSGSEWEGMEVTPFSTPNKSLFLVGVNACAPTNQYTLTGLVFIDLSQPDSVSLPKESNRERIFWAIA